MEKIANLKFQKLSKEEMHKVQGGKKEEACDGKMRELLSVAKCVTLPDGSQVSIKFYGPTTLENLSPRIKKTDAVRQCEDEADCGSTFTSGGGITASASVSSMSAASGNFALAF
jgi:hypothetical protein